MSACLWLLVFGRGGPHSSATPRRAFMTTTASGEASSEGGRNDTHVDRLLELYRTMARIRAFEERAEQGAREGLIKGAVHLSIGQEAVAAGVCANLVRRDFITSTHRGHGHSIANGYAATPGTRALSAGISAAARAEALGIPAVGVDGNDVAAVDTIAGTLIAKIRAGGGPAFLHATTYRLKGHTAADAGAYRKAE